MDTMGFLDDVGHSQPQDFGFLGASQASQQEDERSLDTMSSLHNQNHMGWNQFDSEASSIPDSSAMNFEDLGGEKNEDDYHKEALPPHACTYCGQHDTASVARCNQCKKWFCNSRGVTNGSHIVNHLIRSRHKEVSLHHDSPLGETILECYACGSKNVFLLGFIPSKRDSVVVLLCREPCLNSHTLHDMEWDANAWQPLMEDRQLLPWLCTVPNEASMSRCRPISAKQMNSLEELWKVKPDATLDDLHRTNLNSADMQEIPFHFKDGYHLCDSFSAVVATEADYDKQMREHVVHEGISVRWDTGISMRKVAVCSFPVDELRSAVAPGDEVRFAHPASQWESTATIIRIGETSNAQDEIHCELKSRHDSTPESSSGYTVQMVWKGTSYDRMQSALKVLASDETSISAFLYHKLLGHNVEDQALKVDLPRRVQAPNLPDLNHSQQNAVTTVLQRPLSLIQGPPGTGKTVTSATLVYHMSKQNDAQVLVACPSNVAVDQLAERIAATGLRVVRIAAKSRESVPSTIDHLMLHNQVNAVVAASPPGSEIRRLQKLREETGTLNDRDHKRYKQVIRRAEEDLLAVADVVCCTCVGTGDPRLSKFRFKHVLVDESTQATEPETLIPIVMGAKQVVLVGDHCQLGPVITYKPAAKAGLGRSLFERLVMLAVRPIRLDVQYRMHPCLSEFSSNAFYEGTLQNGVSAADRHHPDVFPWPNADKPTFFYNTMGQEEFSSTGVSFLNRTEAALAEKCVTQLLKSGVAATEIGIVTPYEGQRLYLINYMQRNGSMPADTYKKVEVASVDSFQGREKGYIILSCVRSNEHQGIGFLNDPRRLNVALTRARCGVMIIGNARVLARHPLWHALVTHYKNHMLVVDGALTDLKPLNIMLPKPRVPKNTTYGIASSLPMYRSQIPTEEEAFTPSGNVPEDEVAYVPGVAPAIHFSGGVQAASQASMSGYSQSQDQ